MTHEAPLTVEKVTVQLVAVRSDEVPSGVDVDRIAEEVLSAAFTAAHVHLAAAEGFTRFGDIGPDELGDLTSVARLIVRSILANGPQS